MPCCAPDSKTALTVAAGGLTVSALAYYMTQKSTDGEKKQGDSKLSSQFFGRLSSALYNRLSGTKEGAGKVDHMAVLNSAPKIELREKGAKGQEAMTRL